MKNTILICASIIMTGWLLSHAWIRTHQGNESIKVTGSAQKDIVSDLITWSGSFSRFAPTPREAFSQLNEDTNTIRKYLISKGISEKEIVFSSISTTPVYVLNKEGNSTGETRGYELSQTVEVESPDVDKVTDVSRASTELINSGIQFSSFNPSYYYTKLADLKIEMLSAATKDATLRAAKIAENAGSKIGSLRSARMGVLQITAKNSADYSWGGALDTSSKDKTITAVVYLDFAVQ